MSKIDRRSAVGIGLAAATTTGLQIDVGRASDSLEIEAALATLARNRVDAILVGSDVFFSSRRVQFSTLMMLYGLPAIFNMRDFPEVGGLMSYGTNLIETHRQVGIYVGRILKGANPAELPVIQSTKFEFVVNLVTARALRLEIPPALLARADEVTECNAATSSRCLAVRQPRGRSRCARSRPTACCGSPC